MPSAGEASGMKATGSSECARTVSKERMRAGLAPAAVPWRGGQWRRQRACNNFLQYLQYCCCSCVLLHARFSNHLILSTCTILIFLCLGPFFAAGAAFSLFLFLDPLETTRRYITTAVTEVRLTTLARAKATESLPDWLYFGG